MRVNLKLRGSVLWELSEVDAAGQQNRRRLRYPLPDNSLEYE